MAADAQQGPSPGGGGTQRSFNLAGFDSVSLAGPHDVVVTVGPRHRVRAEGDAETLDRLNVEVDGTRLKIGMKKGNWTSGWKNNRSKTIVYVTLPALRAAAIAGSGDMRVDNVQSDRFDASIAGSGDLQIASLRAGDAKFSIAGSGNITAAAGSAQRTRNLDRRVGRCERRFPGGPDCQAVDRGLGRCSRPRDGSRGRVDHGLRGRRAYRYGPLQREQAGVGHRTLRRLRDFG
jgi:hypothetical protein